MTVAGQSCKSRRLITFWTTLRSCTISINFRAITSAASYLGSYSMFEVHHPCPPSRGASLRTASRVTLRDADGGAPVPWSSPTLCSVVS